MEERVPKNTQRLSIAILAADDDEFKKSLDGLLSGIAKAKTDIELVVLNNKPAMPAHVSENKIFNELLEKKKAIVVSSAKTLGHLLYDASVACSGAVLVFYSNIATYNLPQVVAWSNASKPQLHDTQVIVSSALPVGADNKRFDNLPLKTYNAFVRFFTSLNLADVSSGLLLIKSGTAVLSSDIFSADNYLELVHQLNNTGIPLKELPIKTDKKTGIGSAIGMSFSLFFTGLWLKIKWYFIAPVTSVKEKGAGLDNRNSPLYRMIFATCALALLFLMPRLSLDFGITWDAKLHNEYGYKMLDYFESGGKDTTCFTSHRDYPYYGEHINIISAFLNRNNLSPWGEYETRHIINSLYGYTGMLFCGLIAVELSSWLAGIIALLSIFFFPTFMAHSMNNPTDIPFAAGFAIGTFYIIRLLKQLPKPKFSTLFFLATGIGVAIGSRVGGVLIIAYAGLFMGIQWLLITRETSPGNSAKLIWPYFKALFVTSLIGFLIGISIWPYVREHPITNFIISFQKSTGNAFYANNTELYEGVRMYMLSAPWYYVFKFIGITTPLFILLGLLLSLVLFKWAGKNSNRLFYIFVLFTAVFPLVYAEYKNINHYNGWRHYLLIAPAMVAIAAIGWERLFMLKNKVAALSSLVVFLVLFAITVSWVVKYHPNETVYFNELTGGTRGAYGNYEMDYYSNSCRAAAEWLAHKEPTRAINVAINNEPLTASYYATRINPKITFTWIREYEEQKPMWDYQILTTRTYSKNELINGSFPPKGTVHTIDVEGVPIAAVVKREDYNMPLGYRALDQQKLDSAVYYFNRAVAYAPKDEETWRMLGFSLINRGKLDSAEQMLNKSVEIYPENFSAYSNLGLVYFNRKNFKKAIDEFKQAIKFKENVVESWYYSALAYLNLGDYPNAITQLEGAVKHNASIPEVYFYLGKAYDATGNLEKAAENYQLAVAVNPNYKLAWGEMVALFNRMGKKAEADYCAQKFRALGGG